MTEKDKTRQANPYGHINMPKVLYHEPYQGSQSTKAVGVTIDVETQDSNGIVWNTKAFHNFLKKHLITYCFPPAQCNDRILPEEVSEKYEGSFEFLRKYCDRWKQPKNSKHKDPNHTPLQGVLGEWFLHSISRELFETENLYSKVYLHQGKTAVHGFDLVHFKKEGLNDFTLWLGEAKFYSNLKNSINAALESVNGACTHEYLKAQKREEGINGEIAFIRRYSKTQNNGNKNTVVGSIENFLDTTTIDDFLKKITIPVLLVLPKKEIEDLSNKSRDDVHRIVKDFCSATSSNFFDSLNKKHPNLKEIDIKLIVLPLGNFKTLLEGFEKKIIGIADSGKI